MNANPILGSQPPAPISSAPAGYPADDATAQAMFLLGLLGLLSSKYSVLEAQYDKSGDPAIKARMDALLAQFNQVKGYFQLSGSSVNFQYNEGQSTINLTDPTLLALVQTMPSDIDKFSVFWNDTTNTPAISILNWIQADKFDFSTASPTTEEAALFFMLSLETSPTGKMSGAANQFLSITRLFPNSFIVAEAMSAILNGDKTLDANTISDALDIDGATGGYASFLAFFKEYSPEWIKNPIVGESQILCYELLFWPEYPTHKSATVNATEVVNDPNKNKDKKESNDRDSSSILETTPREENNYAYTA